MTRFIKQYLGDDTPDLYFTTFKKCLEYNGELSNYNTHYKKLKYYNFDEVKFTFGVISRFEFIDSKEN
jgi:hypothetical protein